MLLAIAKACFPVPPVKPPVNEPVTTPEPTIVEMEAQVVSVVTTSQDGTTDVSGESVLEALESGDDSTSTRPVPPYFKSAVNRSRRNHSQH